MRKIKFEVGEYYHVYNCGVDRRTLFGSKEDYDRFEAYLYLLNDIDSPRAANFFTDSRRGEIFSSGRGEQLVAIGAYSIVQDHFHILMTPLFENGVSQFMQKVQTAYTMYFNKKYGRSGRLFQSTFKARHVQQGAHLKFTYAYIHLNAAYMWNREWQKAIPGEAALLAGKAVQYKYSSVGEYVSANYKILSPKNYPEYFSRAYAREAYLDPWIRLSGKYYKGEIF